MSRVQGSVIRPASVSPSSPLCHPHPHPSRLRRTRSFSCSVSFHNSTRAAIGRRWPLTSRENRQDNKERGEARREPLEEIRKGTGGRKRGNQYERWKREGLENGDSQAPTKIPCQIETGAQAWRTLPAPLLPTTLLARYHHVDTSFVSLHPPPPRPSPYLSLGRYPGLLYFLYTSSSIFLLLTMVNRFFLPSLPSLCYTIHTILRL